LLGVLLGFVLVLTVSASTCSRKEFEAFKTRFNKQYPDQYEEAARFAVFCASLERVNKKNKLQNTNVWGVTKFSDITPEEFRKTHLGCRSQNQIQNKTLTSTTTRTVGPQVSPASFDWRTSSQNILTPVYNQEQCGSCWAFSATESIESQWALAGNQLASLSVQQIVDCDTTSDGCEGGWTQNAYNSVIQEGGQDSWQSYPYTAQDGTCQFDSSNVAAKISSYENVYPNNEPQMASWLAQYGPVSICVDASSWNDYGGGVMSASQCGNSIDHCVLAVGYDTTANPPYWIVRNSWGTDWGVQSGFIYLQFGQNTCDLAYEPTSAQI